MTALLTTALTTALMKPMTKIAGALLRSPDFDCRRAHEAMSAWIDSMSDNEEARRLEAHVAGCPPCRRQLQGYVSLRAFVSGVAAPAVPEDLGLDTRIRLSHVRARNVFGELNIRIANVLKPNTVPALAGVLATMMCFGVLLGSFGASLAQPPGSPDRTLWVHTQPQASGPLMFQLAALGLENLTVELNIDHLGKAYSGVILSGPQDPEVDRWLKDVLLLGDFYPATIYGRPVSSRLILSFIGVRS